MHLLFIVTLVLGTFFLLTICIASAYDSRVQAKSPTGDDPYDFETEQDMMDADDDQYLSLILRHGDDISQKLSEYVKQAEKMAQEASNSSSSDDDYRRFVELLRKLYEEYEETEENVVPTPTVVGSLVMQGDDPDVGAAERDVTQTQENVANRLPEPIRTQLNRLLDRGRRLLSSYRDRINQSRARQREIDRLKQQLQQLDNDRHGLDTANEMLRAQLDQSRRKADELQRSYDDADRKLAEMSRAYDDQREELRRDEQQLAQLRSECEQRSHELTEAIGQKHNSGEQVSKLEQNLRERNETEQSLRKEIDRRANEFAGKTREQEESCNRLRDELNRAIAENRADADVLRGKLTEAEDRLADEAHKHRDAMDELQRQLETAKRDLETTSGQLASSQEKSRFEEGRANDLAAEVKRLKDLLANTAKQFDQKVENVEDAGQLLESLKGQCELYQRSLTDEKDALSKTQDRLRQMEERVAEVEQQLAESKKQLDERLLDLQYEHSEFEEYKQRYNAEAMDQLRNEMLDRVQKESRAKIDCLANLDSRSNELVDLRGKLEAKIRELQSSLTRALRPPRGSSSIV